jgi:hypothetical protein
MSLVIKILDALAAKIFRIMPADPLGTPGVDWIRRGTADGRSVERNTLDRGRQPSPRRIPSPRPSRISRATGSARRRFRA